MTWDYSSILWKMPEGVMWQCGLTEHWSDQCWSVCFWVCLSVIWVFLLFAVSTNTMTPHSADPRLSQDHCICDKQLCLGLCGYNNLTSVLFQTKVSLCNVVMVFLIRLCYVVFMLSCTVFYSVLIMSYCKPNFFFARDNKDELNWTEPNKGPSVTSCKLF